jgi:DNA-binding transcriptional LysR family regulator
MPQRCNKASFRTASRSCFAEHEIIALERGCSIGIPQSQASRIPKAKAESQIRKPNPKVTWKTMRFDLADLSLFRHVVEAGSITRGAERAHLALAAASTRIRDMEAALGVALLTRGRQGVTPTPAGRTLIQHARAILRQAERLHEDLGAYGGGLAGQIRVLSNTNALTEFLPEALSSFLAAHQNVSVDLEERLSDEIVGLIAEGVADLGIIAGTVDAGTLETYPFRRDRFVLVVARDHPLARRAKIGFADVLDRDFVGLDRASALQRFLAAKAVRIGRPLRLRVQLRSFDAVCRLVECKVGIGIVPETTARRVAKTMAIAVVPLTDAWAERELTICIRSLTELPLYARQLVEHLRAES